ncbi:Phosphatidylinositol kinase (PIK-L1) [Phytophthora cinnamomi]|uniref:Phosphatidylinositol kinase (PIK-L1) n=1 Tax=Phytophthora cinnamomi TaxID=4785 RepID=UPI00355A99CC|nr:Phosphatidylinositol kinase (PIK-L1) [Phytophthora cinnamomi]
MQFQSAQDREHVEALLASLVQRLDEPDAARRRARVDELYAAVAALSRQLSAERFAKALAQLTPQLYQLLQRGAAEGATLGALLAIERLLAVCSEDQFIRFVNYLRYFLQQPHTSRAALLAAASAMGKLAASSVSGTLVASFVDFEAKRAFEWLQDGPHAARNEALVSQRRLAACFVLRELAQAAPTLFHVNLTTFFQSIWGAVRDPRVEIREAATSALAACLQLITKRQTRHRVQWYCKVYDQVFEGLALRPGSNSSSGAVATSSGQTLASWECAHGSLLVIGELIANTGRFMVPRFREVCDTVLLYKDAKEKLVSRAVSTLLPQLAEFCPGAFVQYYLDVCVAHLTKRILEYSAPASERGVAFLAMGRLSLAVGEALLPHLPPILKLVKESLAPHTGSKRKRTRNKLFCVQTLTCVANMSRALGPRFEPFLFQDGVLETMMIGGLSDELIDSLAEVVASVPSALPYVQERLLNEISGILRGTPFSLGSASAAYPPGSSGGAGSATNGDGSELGLDASYYDTASEAAPMKQTAVQALFSSMKRGFSSAEDDPASSSGSLMIKGETGDEIDTILLSLRTLSCFDFSGSFCLLPFVRDCVALYLKNPDARIRKQAVITCSKLLLPSPESPDTALMSSWRHVKKRGPSGRVIDLVLMQLLQVGISDMDVAVRRSVVESLDARFDELLSQEAHLKLVFLLLNDENANIRERAMQLLERLAPRNPAFVMPSLRRVLIQLVTELQHTSDLRMREDSTRLLGHLIRGAQHLVDPYVVRILEVLLPILVRGNAPLTMAVLVTLGELALVSRTQIAAYERYLFPLIIHTLQDHSSIEKRQVALQTLGQLAGSTGCVVRPYLASPKLLEIFLSLLHHSVGSPWSLRREAMRTIGILGALDPYKYKLCISRASLRQANEVASTADTSTAKEDEEKSADSTTIGVSKSVAGTLVSQYPTLDLDLKALGLTINLASFDRKATSDALDEKQQIELQLFTAAPIGTRKIDAAAAAGTLGVGSQSSHPVSGAAGVSAGAPSSSLSSSSRKRRQVGSIGMSLSDDMFDFESSLMDSELELDPTELSPASEAYFPTVAIHALLRILREPSLNAHHHGVIQAIMFIFKSLSTQCVPFLKYILPPFLRVLARGEPRLRESLFLQLTTLISIVNAHMKPFFPPIMVLALRFWGSHLPQIVRLVEKISQAAPHEFRTQYFPKLLPKLLEVLQPHFGLGGGSTDGELSGASPGVGGSTAQNSGDGAGVVAGSADLHGQAEILSFEPLLQQIIASLPFSHRGNLTTAANVPEGSSPSSSPQAMVQRIAQSLENLRRGARVPRSFLDDPAFMTPTLRKFSSELQAQTAASTPASSPPTNVRLHVNQQNLRRAWEASQRSTKEDWLEWMRRFSIELLRESPSAALRSCCALAQAYNPLARALFNPAFVSCWNELYEQYQDYLVRALETAFQSDTIPAEILQTLLNLAEFMEHDVEALPIDIRELGELAQKCHAYAKALHYKELEFHTSPSTCIEALISINNQLGQPEAAVGILKYAQAHHSRVIQVKETWFEKLQDWRAALALYDRRLQYAQQHGGENQGLDIEVCIGKMRCLEALGKWEELSALAAQSVLAVHQGNFEQAATLIDATRKTLDTKLGALVGESYSRAYRSMVTLQQLSELEEVVTYKKLRAQISKGEESARYKRHLMRMWRDRLSGCKRVVEVWQQLIVVRALILSPHEDIDTYLQFASLCRQSGNLSLSLKVFTNALHVHGGAGSNGTGISEMLSVVPSSSGAAPSFGFGEKDRNRVAFAYLKHLWAAGQKQEALSDLHRLVVRISSMARHRSQVPGGMGGMPSPAPAMMPMRSEEEELLVKCHLKMAEWQLAVHDQQIEHVPVESVLSSLRLCTELEPRSYKAWHAWALMNFQVVEHSTHSQHISANATASAVAASASVAPYIAPAIEGFFRSVALGRSRWAANVQQDILRVLTLWFAHGHRTDVHAALEKGFRAVSIETWLIVIPQLIARIHTPYPRIQKQLHRLLVAVGKQHPHALIYPLSVALKSSVSERQQAAEAIMSTMRTNYVELVDEALLVSRELIRVAILWHEMWHEGLEEASRLYFGEHNVDGMAEVLRPLHAMMERGPETLREVSFHGAFGRDLREANEWLQRFLSNRRNESDLNRAWDLYYHVFRRINKQLPQITTLELQVVSPNLLSARNLQLAVPGTYRAGHAIVKIGSFLPTVAVITSKQRPRRITIVGSNGLEYMFLLKGHEDLRQDERVTQLFGLVNALLINDRNTSKKDLKIHRYPVIPLSDNAGIVGWVPHCDTLHQLIRDYREARKILLNIEHRLMLQMAPDYDALTLLEKVEVFQYALENTAGQDLYKVLWLKSENSEVWLDRRTNYTRSLAVMSMVGYILGLGDRHPSNLMLHRFTGTIVHIDFGDCFEVAMDREKYPEKIPFRLTRMLTNAMEVSGIEGNFRFSCESVMAVLRENRHSLMAMLEAFVHDPLINWRLLSATNVPASSHASSSVASSIASSSVVSSMYSESEYEPSEASSHGPSEASSHGPSEASSHGPSEASTHGPSEASTHGPSEASSHGPSETSTHGPSEASSHGPSEASTHGPSEASSHGPSEASTHGPSEASSHGPGEEELPHRRSESISIPDQVPSSTATLLDDRDEPLPTAAAAPTRQRDQAASSQEQDSNGNVEEKQEANGSTDQQGDAGATEARAEVATPVPQQGQRQLPPRAKPPVPRQVSGSLAAPRQLPPRAEPKDTEAAPPPLPSSLSSRPMSLSKSIPLPMRKLPPRAPAANRVREDTIDENEEANVVEKIDYTTTNLHAEISTLAASVSSVGHSSLSRSFSVTQAQIQAQSRAAEQQQQMRQRQLAENGQAGGDRQPVAPSTPLGPPPRMAPAASTSFVSVTAATQIPPASEAVPPSVANDLHANRSVRERELLSALGPEGIAAPRVALNEKAVAVIRRVQAKLSGRDFEGEGGEPLDVSAQVQRLISQATSHENLCQCYIGWCPFW